jgi:hypothetical protein
MKFIAKVHEPMFEFNSKKYIRFIIPAKVSEIIERMHTSKSHLLMNQNIDNPLDGSILTVKVPFRYRRVMCEVKGRPIQSLIRGDEAEVVVDFKGVWNVGNYSGLLLDALELLHGLIPRIRVVGEVNCLKTTLLESLKGLEHTLKPEYFLGHLLDSWNEAV